MLAGKLRHRISIEQLARVEDGGGGSATTWSELTAAYAKVVPLRGDEGEVAGQVGATLTHRIEMRYRAGVTSKMRVNLGGRVMNIRAVINVDERNRELHLMCEEMKPVG